MRVPVYLSLYLGGLIGFIIFTDLEINFIAQTFLLKLQNFSLISIPFFILLGNLMVKGESAKRLVEFAIACVYRLPAGLPITGVVASGVFGAVSGSSISTLVTIGSILLPDLERQRYPKDLTIGLLSSAAVLGIIIPPSIIMIVCALTAGESVIRLFAAGYLPGMIIILALSIYAFMKVKFSGAVLVIPKEKKVSFRQTATKAMPPLLLLVMIFAGIYSGAFTVTEASVASCVFAIILECFIYRKVGLKEFYELLHNTFLVSGALVITVSGAGVISEYITIREIPEQIMNFALQYIPNKYVYLLFINILLLIVGTFIDPIGAIMILVPIIVPIGVKFGIDQTHLCLIITIALGIGYLTPPLGLLLYTACAVSKKDFVYVVRAVMPSLMVFIATLLLVSYIPFVSTFIPDLLLGAKK